MTLQPSYQQGFAPRDYEPLYPELWRGCVGAWAPCLGATGTVLRDHSGYGNHGTLTNFALSGTTSNWVPSGGKIALNCDGVNDHIIGSDTQNLRIPYGTITGWFSTATTSSMLAIFCSYSQNSNVAGITLGVNIGTIGVGKIGVVIGKNTGNSYWDVALWYGDNRVDDSILHSFACVIPVDGVVQFYVDGKSMTTQRVNGGAPITPVYAATNYVTIGAERTGAGTGKYWPGILDDIRIYNRVLTEQEIRLLASERGVAYKQRSKRRFSQQTATGSRRLKLLTGLP